jgi:hypothetical protein
MIETEIMIKIRVKKDVEGIFEFGDKVFCPMHFPRSHSGLESLEA